MQVNEVARGEGQQEGLTLSLSYHYGNCEDSHDEPGHVMEEQLLTASCLRLISTAGWSISGSEDRSKSRITVWSGRFLRGGHVEEEECRCENSFGTLDMKDFAEIMRR